MRIIKDLKTKRQIEFDGLGDVLAFVNMQENREKHQNAPSNESICGSERFTGTTSWEDAEKFANEGWSIGRDAILDKLKEVNSRVADYTTIYRWDVTGDCFDVGLVVSGEPECWLHPEPEPARRVISICVNIGASCSVGTTQIQNRGAAILSLIEKLQENPCNIVELELACPSSDTPNMPTNTAYYINVGMSPLPINDIAFMLAHPSMLRRFMFAVMERDSDFKYLGNYGAPADIANPAQYDVYLDRSYSADGLPVFNTMEGAAQWVDDTIHKLNREEEAAWKQ